MINDFFVEMMRFYFYYSINAPEKQVFPLRYTGVTGPFCIKEMNIYAFLLKRTERGLQSCNEHN